MEYVKLGFQGLMAALAVGSIFGGIIWKIFRIEISNIHYRLSGLNEQVAAHEELTQHGSNPYVTVPL